MGVPCWRLAARALLLALFLAGPLSGQLDGETEGAEAAHDEAESDDPAAHVHDEIVVTGTRARQRSITESMAPIDVISSEHVAHQGETNSTCCCATWFRR